MRAKESSRKCFSSGLADAQPKQEGAAPAARGRVYHHRTRDWNGPKGILQKADRFLRRHFLIAIRSTVKPQRPRLRFDLADRRGTIADLRDRVALERHDHLDVGR